MRRCSGGNCGRSATVRRCSGGNCGTSSSGGYSASGGGCSGGGCGNSASGGSSCSGGNCSGGGSSCSGGNCSGGGCSGGDCSGGGGSYGPNDAYVTGGGSSDPGTPVITGNTSGPSGGTAYNGLTTSGGGSQGTVPNPSNPTWEPEPVNTPWSGGSSGGTGPGSGMQFVQFKPTNSQSNSAWGPVMQDVMNHQAPGDNNNFGDLITDVHEATHGINSYIRNKMAGGKANGFYLGQGRAVMFPEPKMKLSQVEAFVPPSLRGSRFQLYLRDQRRYFENEPLYVFDEWVAYTNGAAAGVDLAKRGMWKSGWRDGVAGEMEFLVYGMATVMAISKHDPGYFDRNPQFKEFVGFMVNRTMESYTPGSQMPEFKWAKQDNYLAALRTSKDAEVLRGFTSSVIGKDWISDNLGF